MKKKKSASMNIFHSYMQQAVKFYMADIRRNTKEANQVYQMARQAISQNGSIKDSIAGFLRDFEVDGEKKYMKTLQRIADGKSNLLEISLDDVKLFSKKDVDIASDIVKDTQRMEGFFYDACESLMPTPSTGDSGASVTFAVSEYQKWLQTMAQNTPENIMTKLKWKFQIVFKPSCLSKTLPLRSIKASTVGSLVSLDCVVTKVSSVQSRLEIASYLCESCGAHMWQTVSDDSFMPVTECLTPVCKTNRVAGKIQLNHRTSKLVAYQEVRVQEPSRDVPMGSVPRSMTVILKGPLTHQLLPGESVTITGVYSPIKHTGFSKIRRGNQLDMQLHVHHVVKHKQVVSADDLVEMAEMERQIEQVAVSGDGYEKLAKSIAPEIYGHLDVKKALLLMLVGGVTKSLNDVRIRGDMHVLLMGDPGIAKSQLLKQICQIAPRAIYTTGKGSSGVGLTACVTRDKDTGEVSLEGGALVLADNGICCIDEFDKMEESDRSAIHEVMEQQTVSIAKAGITTTLNARSSVLAAANPAYGRYDISKSVQQNINLPAALLSRFDLQFLLLDRNLAEVDTALAKHVGAVHQYGEAPRTLDFDPFTAKFIRSYVLKAKTFEPNLDKDLLPEISNTYVNARAMERTQQGNSHVRSVTNVRTLLGMLRLAQAHARLRFSNVVERGDFEEAVRLTLEAKQSVLDQSNAARQNNGREDPIAAVWNILKTKLDMAGKDNYILVTELEKFALNHGFTLAEIQASLASYEDLSIVAYNDERNRVCLTSH